MCHDDGLCFEAFTDKIKYMAKYGKKSQEKVEKAMHEMKEGKLKSGRSGKKVTNPKQAVAIGLSEAREEGGKVPKEAAAKPGPKKSTAKKSTAKSGTKKTTTRKAASKPGPKKGTTRKSTAKSSTQKKTTAQKATRKKAAAAS